MGIHLERTSSPDFIYMFTSSKHSVFPLNSKINQFIYKPLISYVCYIIRRDDETRRLLYLFTNVYGYELINMLSHHGSEQRVTHNKEATRDRLSPREVQGGVKPSQAGFCPTITALKKSRG